jgi:hypothetical protein
MLFVFYLNQIQDDPFCLILIRMIDEENNLCLNQKPNHFNLQLVNELKMINNIKTIIDIVHYQMYSYHSRIFYDT